MKKALGVLLLISVLGNVALLYRVFDLGVTETFRSDELSRRTQQVAVAQKLMLPLISDMSRMELLSTAQKAGLEVLDKGEEGVYVGEILFVFSADQVTAIRSE